jgi:uncharacterized membrane protein YdbT with pleckstrin-like domain
MTLPDWAPAEAGETVVWQGQPRVRVVHRGVAVGVIAALVVAAVGYGAVADGASSLTTALVAVPIALVAAAVPATRAWLWRRTTSYVLTDAALYHRSGVLSVEVTALRLGKVQNTSYSQGIFGTRFDHGTVTVETAGGDGTELRLRELDGPAAVHRRIAELAGATDGRSGDAIPGSLTEWQAVRAEVRRIRAALRQ